jgi:hypothetical protein
MYATQLCLVQVNESVVSFCSEKTERHATGKVLPHTTEEFSSNEQNMLSTFDPHNHSQKDVHSLKAICFNEKEPKGQGGKGDRKDLYPYLVFLVLAVEPTAQAMDGHVLGVAMSCSAGLGICMHKKACLYTQLHIWGPQRNVEKPPTLSLCWCISTNQQCGHNQYKAFLSCNSDLPQN